MVKVAHQFFITICAASDSGGMEVNMINLQRKEECCGCNACGDICPKSAITFCLDNEGCWYPNIDLEKCIKCGLCDKVCPILHKYNLLDKNSSTPECYAAEHKSIEVIFSSTTGGMFSALADVMYNQKGYVGGAVHNEDFSVSHFISNDKADLQKLRRSKDLQSNAEGFYLKVREILEEGHSVLVCGVPCQIAALKNFLSKEYENLITVDLICAGVNSPKVWKKYLSYIEDMNNSKIVWTENKSKEYGWTNLTQKFVFENGEEYFDTRKTSFFTQGFIDSHLYCRPSCYECKYKGFPRVADITIGDFWGIRKYSKKYNSDMGTSVVLINSEKGKTYFEKIKKRINSEKTPLEWALAGNPALLKSISKISNQREEFFADLDQMPFDKVVKKYSVMEKSTIKGRLMRLKHELKYYKLIVTTTQLSPVSLFQTVRYSGFKNLINHKGLICGKNCHLNIAKSSNLQFEGLLVLGRKDKFRNSKLESRLFIGENATLKILGRFDIDADCEIVVFNDAELTIHGSKHGYSDANAGLRIICGQRIEIMSDVGIGRSVLIRDTNGNHFMNTSGYRTSRPVVIGEKVWLCESCTIMPGVKLGRGAIVGTNSTVIKSVPSHALVSGFPASVVQENVLWKC